MASGDTMNERVQLRKLLKIPLNQLRPRSSNDRTKKKKKFLRRTAGASVAEN